MSKAEMRPGSRSLHRMEIDSLIELPHVGLSRLIASRLRLSAPVPSSMELGI